MKNNLLRLKNDILNDLRNERYYVLDELQNLVDSSAPQKNKVNKSKELIKAITIIDHQIATTDAIFVISDPEMPISNPNLKKPTNVVEDQLDSSYLNEKGQSHSE